MSSLLSILKMAGIVCVFVFPVTWLRRSLVWSQTPAELTSLIRASEHPQLGWGVGLAQPASNPTHSEQRGRPEFIWKRFKDLQKLRGKYWTLSEDRRTWPSQEFNWKSWQYSNHGTYFYLSIDFQVLVKSVDVLSYCVVRPDLQLQSNNLWFYNDIWIWSWSKSFVDTFVFILVT